MSHLKAIIIDDESRARSVLSNLLERNCPDVEIIDQCGNLPEGVLSIKKNKPNLVFIDVQMPEYNGYEINSFLSDINFEIIFVTAFDQYALKAFELCATDYLLKPVNRERLKAAVKKAQVNIQSKKRSDHYQELLVALKTKKNAQIVIPDMTGKKVLQLVNIIAIEGQGAYSVIHLDNDSPLMTSKHLKYYEEVLSDQENFIRCHKSWIVNTQKIEKLLTINQTLEMEGGVVVKLSKLKRALIEDALSHH